MPKRRKIRKEIEPAVEVPPKKITAIQTVVQNAQTSESFHNKYIKELKILYTKSSHEEFMNEILRIIKVAMLCEENHEFANTALKFCAKYVTSYDEEETHPVLVTLFDWLLTTMSNNPLIRFRLCQFVNLVLNSLGPEAALDDCICDKIHKYMIEHLRDLAPNVRVQAILALQRLQIPDNPDDVISKTYFYHLCSDPSPKVRQAVISSIGRNYHTIPHIIERLWDVDEKVRRHTYLQMSSYPVKSYKVSQRLTFLEQGLNDHSECVKKVVANVMLPQWLESYNKDFVAFIGGLKLDANEFAIERFRKTSKLALLNIFKKERTDTIIGALGIKIEKPHHNEDEEEFHEDNQTDDREEFEKCVDVTKMTIEMSIYWLSIIEYFQSNDMDEIDLILPDLTTFCRYIEKFCESQQNKMDKWQKLEYQYILLSFIEILSTYDYGDEIGRENLKELLYSILKNYDVEEQSVKLIASIYENLITDKEERIQLLVNVVNENINPNSSDGIADRELIESILEKQSDKSLELKLSALKVKILDLKEMEMTFVEKKDYVNAQKATDEWTACKEEYTNLLKPLLDELRTSTTDESGRRPSDATLLGIPRKVTTETVIKCLQLAYYTINSKNINSLIPAAVNLYKEFIVRNIESNNIVVRDWALKCAHTFSMLYDVLSKEVYLQLCGQFYKNHNTRIWKTAIQGVFELIDRYGFEHFDSEEKQSKLKKGGRQLYNTTTEYPEQEENNSSQTGSGIDILLILAHFLETCDEPTIVSALIEGYCRLVLRGLYTSYKIVSKLMLYYFNPTTEPEVNQILGIFFEALMKHKKQEYLQSALLPTLFVILEAPYDSPLQEIKPETIFKFVIESTRPAFCSPGLNIHNTIAMSFLQVMLDNISNKELLKLLSKELLELEISDDPILRSDLKKCVEQFLAISGLDPKTAKNISSLKDILDGVQRSRITFSSTRLTHSRSDNQESDDFNGDSTEVNKNPDQLDPINEGNEEIVEIGVETEPIPEKSNIDMSITSPVTITSKNQDQEVPSTPTLPNIENEVDRSANKAMHRSLFSETEEEILVPATQNEGEVIDETIESIEIPETQEVRDNNRMLHSSKEQHTSSDEEINTSLGKSQLSIKQPSTTNTRSKASRIPLKTNAAKKPIARPIMKMNKNLKTNNTIQKQIVTESRKSKRVLDKSLPSKKKNESPLRKQSRQIGGPPNVQSRQSLSQSSSASSMKSNSQNSSIRNNNIKPNTPKTPISKQHSQPESSKSKLNRSVRIILTPLSSSLTRSHRTRSTAVEEFKTNNIMTRNRSVGDNAKNTFRRKSLTVLPTITSTPIRRLNLSAKLSSPISTKEPTSKESQSSNPSTKGSQATTTRSARNSSNSVRYSQNSSTTSSKVETGERENKEKEKKFSPLRNLHNVQNAKKTIQTRGLRKVNK